MASAELEGVGLPTAIGVVRSQVRLQKLDFWLRNPDYLANELLNDYAETGDDDFLETAAQILDSDEPEVRRYPMLRHHFGAYEPLEDALAVLRYGGLVAQRRRGTISRIRQHDYYLLAKGREVAEQIIGEAPVFSYYIDRVRLVLQLADNGTGSQLKDRQYKQPEYAEAVRGSRISSVRERARSRLAEYRAIQAEKVRGDDA
ncbi:hypothetical protein GCM10010439_55400 [Actinocorallia aurantiaca]|uniref:Uncharacterized protein n=1 Tax=Actinocorallia aurantiaca TaxID=46204 RepID=A0ABN3UJF2_9ACTN